MAIGPVTLYFGIWTAALYLWCIGCVAYGNKPPSGFETLMWMCFAATLVAIILEATP